MKQKSIVLIILVLANAICSLAQQATGSFTDDRDGKTYKTIEIGTQTWMAENLAFNAGTGCLAYQNNDEYLRIYGYLYNWEIANKVCPAGWHLPSEQEWSILNSYLGGDSTAHEKLKERGTEHWKEEDPGVTNESGFTALPGGLFSTNSFKKTVEFKYLGNYAYWWSSTTEPGEQNSLNACFRVICNYYLNEKLDYATKTRGASVRCLKN